MSNPLRETFRVEASVRVPTEDEAKAIRAQREAWRKKVYDREMSGVNGLGIAAVGVAGAMIYAAFTTRWILFFAGIATLVVCVMIFVFGRRAAEQRAAAKKGPWDPPAGKTWKISDTTVVARALVATVSGDEDYMEWWLFEIPGGDWYFADPAMLANVPFEPREEIRIVALHPDGPCLSVTSKGDLLARRGAPEDYATAMERGCVWHPEHLTARGTIEESKLPEWVRD